MLLTTHYMDEAERLCDRLMVMDHGRILTAGTPAELIAANVGAEVLEFRDAPAGLAEKIAATGVHIEPAGENVLVFLRAGEAERALAAAAPLRPYLHRQANLEDVFVRLTGRELRE